MLGSGSAAMDDHVRVAAIVRVPTDDEVSRGDEIVVEANGAQLSLKKRLAEGSTDAPATVLLDLDIGFNSSATCTDVYDVLAYPLIGPLFHGISSNIVFLSATHALYGTYEDPGTFSRAVTDLFDEISTRKLSGSAQVRFSLVQALQLGPVTRLHDLLLDNGSQHSAAPAGDLRIKRLEDATRLVVANPDDLFDAFDYAAKKSKDGWHTLIVLHLSTSSEDGMSYHEAEMRIVDYKKTNASMAATLFQSVVLKKYVLPSSPYLTTMFCVIAPCRSAYYETSDAFAVLRRARQVVLDPQPNCDLASLTLHAAETESTADGSAAMRGHAGAVQHHPLARSPQHAEKVRRLEQVLRKTTASSMSGASSKKSSPKDGRAHDLSAADLDDLGTRAQPYSKRTRRAAGPREEGAGDEYGDGNGVDEGNVAEFGDGEDEYADGDISMLSEDLEHLSGLQPLQGVAAMEIPQGVQRWKQNDVRARRHGARAAVYMPQSKHISSNDGLSSTTVISHTVYKGQWKDGKQHGHGTEVTDTTKYEGMWKNGLCHGQGVLYEKHAPQVSPGAVDEAASHASNAATSQAAHASLRTFSKDGGRGSDLRLHHWKRIYKGAFAFGKRHGFGSGFYENGEVYEGDWAEDRREGFGTYYYQNGDRYEGQWFDDMPHGEGTLVLAGGDYYEGSWYCGKKHGPGTFVYTSKGVRYDGEWQGGIAKTGIMRHIDGADGSAAPMPPQEIREPERLVSKEIERLRLATAAALR